MKSTPQRILKILTRQKSQSKIRRRPTESLTVNPVCPRLLANLLPAYPAKADFSRKNNNSYLVSPFDRVYPELAAVLSAAEGATEEVVEWAQDDKKCAFFVIFLLTIV